MPSPLCFAFVLIVLGVLSTSMVSGASPVEIADQTRLVPIRRAGEVPVLVIPAAYPGSAATFTSAQISAMFNQQDFTWANGQGAVRDYLLAASQGRFRTTFTVAPWVAFAKTRDQYFAEWITRPPTGEVYYRSSMGSDALAALAATGFDFRPFDGDGDGFVDFPPIVVHQGRGLDEVRYTIGQQNMIGHFAPMPSPVTYNGVRFDTYITGPELRGTDHPKAGLFCHEIGHALGLPELYDSTPPGTLLADIGSGIGSWSLMSWWDVNASSPYPILPGAWERSYLGWGRVVDLSSSASGVTLPASAASDGVIYRIRSGCAPQEYFLIENRTRSGFDGVLPGAGLLVWHVDESLWDGRWTNGAPVNSDENRRLVDLIQADGLANLNQLKYLTNPLRANLAANQGDAGDPFPGTANVRSLSSASNPRFASYVNGALPWSLSAISNAGPVMSFSLTIGPVGPVAGDANGDGVLSSADLTFATRRFGTRSGDPGFAATADLDGSGGIDAHDLSLITRALGH